MRSFSLAGAVLVNAICLMAAAQEANPSPASMQRRVLNVQPDETPLAQAYASPVRLPGYRILHIKNVQEELGLTPEQQKRLEASFKDYSEDLGDDPAMELMRSPDIKPEELRKLKKERADICAKRANMTKREVEQILTPKQIEYARAIDFRRRGVSMLYMPHMLQQIELTGQQQRQITAVHEETRRKLAQVQRESEEKALSIITPEQTKKLRELSE